MHEYKENPRADLVRKHEKTWARSRLEWLRWSTGKKNGVGMCIRYNRNLAYSYTNPNLPFLSWLAVVKLYLHKPVFFYFERKKVLRRYSSKKNFFYNRNKKNKQESNSSFPGVLQAIFDYIFGYIKEFKCKSSNSFGWECDLR